MSYYSTPSLLSLCLDCITKPSSKLPFTDDFTILPPNLKDPLRKVFLKRGLSGRQLSTLLHGKVTELDLSDSLITRELMDSIILCTRLRKLNLNSDYWFEEFVKEKQTVEELPESKQIEELLSKNRQLVILHMRNLLCVSDSVISALPSTITHLDLGGCTRVTDAGVTQLCNRCLNLSSLSLARTKITDSGLIRIGESRSGRTLKEIRLDGCKSISDAGIEGLLAGIGGSGQSALEILIFHKCPNITERSRLALEEFLMEAGGAMRQLTWTVY